MAQGVVGLGDSAQMVAKLIEKVAMLERSLMDAEKVRRKLHNDLVEIRGNVRVFCRIRPCDVAPVAEATSSDSMRLMVDGKPNDFFFDKCALPSIGRALICIADFSEHRLLAWGSSGGYCTRCRDLVTYAPGV
jgi:uncharacterized protein YfkK (UPF0435 family)